MSNPVRLETKSNKVAVGRNDVIVHDSSLSNTLLKDSSSVLVELQKTYGATVSLDEIEIDHNGAVVISNAALAQAVKTEIVPGSHEAFNFCLNISCGDTQNPIDKIVVDRNRVRLFYDDIM